jgi:hypothetical protein
MKKERDEKKGSFLIYRGKWREMKGGVFILDENR